MCDCSQGVHLDDSSIAAAAHCECTADTAPVCPRCGGTRQLLVSRHNPPTSLASSLGIVASTTEGDEQLIGLPVSPTSLKDVFDTPPSSATVPRDDEDADEEARCYQRLHSASDVTSATTTAAYHHHQQRSFSAVTAAGSFLPDPTVDVGGVSVRSAPDSAFLVRQPEVVSSHGGQRSKLQRFFEPLKRSRSAGGGNQKDAISAAQASLYDPTRQHLSVDNGLNHLVTE